MSLRLVLALFLLVPFLAGAQVRIANTINDLRTVTAPSLTSTNVDVLGYYATGDWGEKRRFTLTIVNPGATNRGNIFTSLIDTNRFWIADDRFALRQDVRWWGPTVSPPTAEVAINAAARWLTNGVIDFPSGYFRAGALIDITNNVVLEGNGFETFLDMKFNGVTLNGPSLRMYGGIGNPFPMMTAAPAGTNKICSDQDFGLVAGDLIMLHNPANNSYGGHRAYYNSGQFAEVLEIVAVTNIFLKGQIWENLPATGVNIHKVSPIRAGVKNMKLGFPPDTSGLQVIYAQDFTLSGVNAFGSSYSQVNFANCFRIEMPDNFIDWDSDPIVGLNYGVIFGGCEFANVRGGLYRSGRHGSTSGNSPTGYSIPNRFLRFLGTTVDSTREEQFGADFHGNAWGCGFYNCDLPKGVDIGGNEIEIFDCRISNPNTAQSVFSQELLGASIRIKRTHFRIRNGTTAGNTWGVRLFYRGAIGDYAGTDTNNWAGTKPNPGGQWLEITDNVFEFLNPITSSTYLLLIDEATTLSSNTNAVKAVFGGVRVTGNIVSVPNSQVYANGYGDTAALFIIGKTNMFWREWDVGNNHFANLAFRGSLGARDVRVYGNTWTNVINPTGAIYLIPGDVQYGTADVRTWRNTVRGANGSGIYMADVAGTLESSEDFFQDWFAFTSGYAVANLYTAPAFSNVVSRVSLIRNTYDSSQAGVTASSYIQALAAHGVKRDEVFLRFANDSGSFLAASKDVQSRTTNKVSFSTTVALGQKTTAELALMTNVGDNVFATDITLNKLMKSFGGSWYDIIPTNVPYWGVLGPLNAQDGVFRTLTTTPAWTKTTAPIADHYNPLYTFNSLSNLVVSWQIQNGNSGSAAGARLLLSAIGGTGSLTVQPSNAVIDASQIVLASTTRTAETAQGFLIEDLAIALPSGGNFYYLYDLQVLTGSITNLSNGEAASFRIHEVVGYIPGSAYWSDSSGAITTWTIVEEVKPSGNTTLFYTLADIDSGGDPIVPGSLGSPAFFSSVSNRLAGTWTANGVFGNHSSFHNRDENLTGPFGVPPAAKSGGIVARVTGPGGAFAAELNNTNMLRVSDTTTVVATPEFHLRAPTNTLVQILGMASDSTSTAQRIIGSTLANVISAAGIVTEAPSDSLYYLRRNAAWTDLGPVATNMINARLLGGPTIDGATINSATIADGNFTDGVFQSSSTFYDDNYFQASTNIGTYVAAFTADATSAPQLLGTMTTSNFANLLRSISYDAIYGRLAATNYWTGASNMFSNPVFIGTTNVAEAIAGKQPAFTTGVGATNIANVLSGNYTPGSNITLATNANGAVAISSVAGGVTLNGSGTHSNIADTTTIKWVGLTGTASGHVTNVPQANVVSLVSDLADKQPNFTTGVGVTNQATVLSLNATSGTNIVFVTNAFGAVSINSTVTGIGVTTEVMKRVGWADFNKVFDYTNAASPTNYPINITYGGVVTNVACTQDSVIGIGGILAYLQLSGQADTNYSVLATAQATATGSAASTGVSRSEIAGPISTTNVTLRCEGIPNAPVAGVTLYTNHVYIQLLTPVTVTSGTNGAAGPGFAWTNLVAAPNIRLATNASVLTIDTVPLGRVVDIVVSNTVAQTQIIQFVIPAGTLSTDGDGVEVVIDGRVFNNTGGSQWMGVHAVVSGTNMFAAGVLGPSLITSASPRAVNIKVVFRRQSSTTCKGTVWQHAGAAGAFGAYSFGAGNNNAATDSVGWESFPVDWSGSVTGRVDIEFNVTGTLSTRLSGSASKL